MKLLSVKNFTLAAGLLSGMPLLAAEKATVTPLFSNVADSVTIPAEIYGQFAEHLGTCIYGGLWVGENSPIPNTSGYRNDVLNALKELKVPVMRWPGGCFADEYHWTDGIGPKENRPVMVNTNWGGTVEDNSFGTHEFFNLCELIGCEPYLSGNVGSGTVEELAKWVEYITAENGPMADQRKKNGREKPWKLKYLGVGNESWGCGGSFTPEAYANEYRRYQTYCRNFNVNRLYKIASGASDYDYNWTDVLMKNAGRHMNGLSLHYYTVKGWNGSKGAATKFDNDDYYWTLGKCLEIEDVINNHDSIMDKYDPAGHVALIVDEWGTWWDEEPGTISGHLYQQNTMRDAMVAALSLNVFHRHTDRVKMANIAQIANVLQSMILTKDGDMVLTPTYYVFKMYIPHQNATVIPLDIKTSTRAVRDGRTVPTISATASKKDGEMNITLTNIDLDNPAEITIPLGNDVKASGIKGEILTAGNIDDYNDFGSAEKVTLKQFDKVKYSKGALTLTLPAKSIVSLSMKI
ncbi:alpha-L-arabinofuranosidase C-terminal domain-containing protein [uncultured Duncaniella sp.]|uniref:alpha-N-arabinofuranosidase n=1 Tax=uncultured Duncaniella sp. TaxID=2768039 RepID=UPI0025B06F49|nr:alpha-L-arabinofuranosidase C-terminal domain-containing protein [uncultured Duncaniella sp.]